MIEKIDFKSQILALFDTSLFTQFSKFNNFLWACWFFCKNLSNFVPPGWKLYNPYCHNTQSHVSRLVKCDVIGWKKCRRSKFCHTSARSYYGRNLDGLDFRFGIHLQCKFYVIDFRISCKGYFLNTFMCKRVCLRCIFSH